MQSSTLVTYTGESTSFWVSVQTKFSLHNFLKRLVTTEPIGPGVQQLVSAKMSRPRQEMA